MAIRLHEAGSGTADNEILPSVMFALALLVLSPRNRKFGSEYGMPNDE